jgi:hypothetical protein
MHLVSPIYWSATTEPDAIDVKFEIIISPEGAAPDPRAWKRLNVLGLVKTGIPYMSPGAEYRAYFEQMVGRSDADMATNIHLKVRYRSAGFDQYEDCYPVDLLHYVQRMHIGKGNADKAADELAAIRKQLELICHELSRRDGIGE